MTGFFARLEERARTADSLVCVGIDPRVSDAAEARDASLRLIEATAPYAAAFKPNSAFFEALGPEGVAVLIEVVAAVPEGIPVILDAKRGDISSTAAAYAQACFDVVGAGAVTLSPYLGRDAIEPFLAHADRGAFILCRTSNPSGSEIQDLDLGSGPLHERVARLVAGWGGPERLGLVVGATFPEALGRVRSIVPEHWILAPGVGAQGADVDRLGVGLRSDGMGLLVPTSRAVADAPDPAAAARDLRDALRRLRPVTDAPTPSRLALDLHAAGCVRFGEFILRSGVVSPVYVDLRRVTGSPDLLRRVAAEYAGKLAALRFDRIGAVPYGALPIATAVSLHGSVPLVWPRPEEKGHGTGVRVEGGWERGERVVLVDDVVTSGGSAIEAASMLREAGLVVEDLVVLLDRGSAVEALAGEGLRLHAVMTLRSLVDELEAAGSIDAATHRSVLAFLDEP